MNNQKIFGLLFAGLLSFSLPAQTQAQSFPENEADALNQDQGLGGQEALACVSSAIPGIISARDTVDGVEMKHPTLGIIFANNIMCVDGRIEMANVVIINEFVRVDQSIGSAIKADALTLWTPTKRAECKITVDYGFEARGFRWFNWNDKAEDGGNKRFEVIKNQEGKEVRISTMSHFRASNILWAPKPDESVSACALTGAYEIRNADVRWSRGGTANGIRFNKATGEFSVPFLISDAQNAQKGPNFNIMSEELSVSDITENQMFRVPLMTMSSEASSQSALPWAFLINKYAHDLVYRKPDDSLLLRVLPLDLANTIHFTSAKGRLSAPNITAMAATLLPSNVNYNASEVSLSNIYMGMEAAYSLTSGGPAKLLVNSSADGLGEVASTFSLQPQLFGKEHLKAVSEGRMSLLGKSGPALLDASILFRDLGAESIFLSIMKNRPSSYVLRNATNNIDFWRDISLWLSYIENEDPKRLIIFLSEPQLMVQGFWDRMPKVADVEIAGSAK